MKARSITDDWEISQDTAVQPKKKKSKPRSREGFASKKAIDLDPRFGKVEFLVEATHFEKFSLWERNERYLQDPKLMSVKKWEAGTGILVEVGQLDDRPVVVSFFFDKLDGHLIAHQPSCRSPDD